MQSILKRSLKFWLSMFTSLTSNLFKIWRLFVHYFTTVLYAPSMLTCTYVFSSFYKKSQQEQEKNNNKNKNNNF